MDGSLRFCAARGEKVKEKEYDLRSAFTTDRRSFYYSQYESTVFLRVSTNRIKALYAQIVLDLARVFPRGIGHLPPIQAAQIVDLGCGAGRNAGELLIKFPSAHVTAIDYSALSVEKAAAYNRKSIDAGRCTVRQGDVSELALPEDTFDLATAFETVYFWPGLEKCFAQVASVLKPGGYFLICNESDGLDATMALDVALG